MGKFFINICLLIMAILSLLITLSYGKENVCNSNKIVYLEGGDEYFFYCKNNELFYNKIKFLGRKISFKNHIYYWDLTKGKVNYKKYSIENYITIKDNKLFYKNKEIQFKDKLEIRSYYNQAVQWGQWVILLGRTSITDDIANDRPPFFSTEIIYFNIKDRKANVLWLDFNQPRSNRSMLVLEPSE